MIKLEVKIYQLKNGQYMTSYVNPLNRKRFRNKFNSLKEAKHFKNNLEHKYASNEFNALSDAYVNQLIAQHLKKCPNSLLTSRRNHFLSFSNKFGHFKISELRKSNLSEWFDQIQKEGNLTDRTLARVKTQLNHFFNYLLEEEIIIANPLDKVKIKRSGSPVRARVILSAPELHDILEKLQIYSPNALYPICYTLIYTGARRMEVLSLRWDNIDFNNKLITFRNTKNGEDRSVKMAKSLYDLLINRKKVCDYVFYNKYNQMFSGSQLSRQLQKFKNNFTFKKDFRPHDFRHSFAFNFLKKGGEMYQLKAILGHKTIQMTVDLYGEMKAHHIDNPCPYE